MRSFFLISLLFFIQGKLIIAQKMPDYKERSFTVFSDTSVQKNMILTATEGAVVPEEYVLGPGDIIFISISGLEERTFTIPVDHEGNLYLPKIGGVDLKNKNLAEAKQKITSAIDRYYKDVEVFISLAEFKKIKVSLIGDVITPAAYILPGNARLMDLLTMSQGVNETSNYRNIQIRNADTATSYDLLKFLRFGSKDQNPRLREGDVVIIDRVDKIVSLSGQVKYPGSYEFVESETAGDLLQIAGGLLNKARRDSIEIISFDGSGKTQYSRYFSYKELIENDAVTLKSQDHIVVRIRPDYLIDRYVTITGYVKYPGFYKIIKDKTSLFNIIAEAGGFREDASLTEATLTRTVGIESPDPEFERLKLLPRSEMTDDEYDYMKAKSRQRIGKVVVDFKGLFVDSNLTEDIQMIEGDVINIPQKKNYITLIGQVVNPGNIVYNPEYTYEDYIDLAGGYAWRALEGEVRVIRANTGEWIYADDADEIHPGDAIWIPEDPPGPKFWDVFTTSLNILGQVAAVIAAVVAVVIASR